MAKFIIGYGWDETEIIEAPSIEDARQEAANRSMALGLLDDDLSDCCWAEPWTEGLAIECGLIEDAPAKPYQIISLRG